MTYERNNLTVGVMAVVLSTAGLGWGVYTGVIPDVVSPKSEFSCALSPDSERGGENWAVIYRKADGSTRPWLRMVHEMGEGYSTPERCQEIARRMNVYKEDGLVAFDYKPATETQYVICARTRASEFCHILVTLVPGSEVEAYEALQRVIGALMPGNPASYQTSGEITEEHPMTIPLEDLL